MTILGIAVQQETESDILWKRYFDLVPIVSGREGSDAVKAEDEVRSIKRWDKRDRIVIGGGFDEDLFFLKKSKIGIVHSNVRTILFVVNHFKIVVSAVERWLKDSIIEILVQSVVRNYDGTDSLGQNFIIDDIDEGAWQTKEHKCLKYNDGPVVIHSVISKRYNCQDKS